MAPPAAPATIWTRATLTVQRWVTQILAPIEIGAGGSGSGPADEVWPSWSPTRALSALATSPWARACIRARCDDTAGLPLMAVRGRRDALPLDDHPFLELMRRPSPGVSETALRRQIMADLTATGNAYFWLRRLGDWWEVHRLHPEHVRAEVRDGVITGWRVGYIGRRLTTREVYHVHDVCWSPDVDMVYGESPLRALDPGMRAVQSSREHATTSARRGRPDLILSFDANTSISQDRAEDIAIDAEQQLSRGRGVFVVGGGVAVHPVQWSPKEVQFEGLDDRVRDETLAVLRVPPTKAGVPQANYAVSRSELREYWGALIVGDLRLLEDAYTAMAHEVGGSMDVAIRHDVSGVEALQVSYDQRQARAGYWVTVFGADPAQAAAYEGFRDAPTGTGTPTQAMTRPAKEVSDQPARQMVAGYLRGAADRLQGGGGDAAEETWRLAAVLEAAVPTAPPLQILELAEQTAGLLIEGAAVAGDRDLADAFPFRATYADALVARAKLLVQPPAADAG